MSRLPAVRTQLKRLRCEALLCTGRTNVRYLTGFTGSNGAVLITPERAWFLTDFRYKTQSAEQVQGFEIVVTPPRRNLLKSAGLLARQRRLKRVAFEADHLTVAQLEDARKVFQRVALHSTREVVERMRMVKDEIELNAIRRANAIADSAYEYLLGRIRPGRREADLARELEQKMSAFGADGLAFEPIVISGTRTALPHGRPSDKRIDRGDLITLDFGALWHGYRSDCTRTICVGRPTAEQQRVYRLVRDAMLTAQDAVRAGANCRATDKLARDLIAAAGHGKHFGHGLGHGVGLDIHESPRFSPSGRGKLAAGMVMTVEPGVYVEGWGGVRIENLVIVREDGCEVVTRAPNPSRIPVV